MLLFVLKQPPGLNNPHCFKTKLSLALIVYTVKHGKIEWLSPYAPSVRQCIYLYARLETAKDKRSEARQPDQKLARNFRACTQRSEKHLAPFSVYARSNLLGKLFRISDRTKRCVSCKSLKAYITGSRICILLYGYDVEKFISPAAFARALSAVAEHERAELVYRDGNLVSGSLEALVQHMVPTEDYYPDRAYLFAFLLSARLFIKPHELLGEVCALCEHQQNLNGEGGKERLHRFVPRLVQLLTEWTETFPYDFRDERVMGHVRNITQKVANVDAAARQEVSVLLQNLLVKFTALERYEEALSRLANEATTEPLAQVDVTELCPSATVLAQQLTHIELERLSYIGPEEFVQAFAKVSESAHLETSFKDMKKTRNLESYVQWFNRLSYFVATEVCKHAKKKQRVRVVEYWIEAARECFNIGNFNSLMAIIAGLNMSPISRLKKTWSKVQSAKFSILETQMDPTGNFSSYRSTLKAAMWRSAGATDERQRIVVPFFSLLVKDLYFLNEGCSNKLPNGHINFEKFWQLAKQVTEFIAWKQVACPFEKNTRVIAFLQASPVLSENALALASFECEPPDNNHEKDRYKALK
uniref:Ras-GEF domain-containing family member 1B n=1 Tax=Trichogramma kaykai TaxID=54128 RepID=A0ABD2XCJ1_9HYME